MEEKEFKKIERRRLLITGTICIITLITAIGYTYSYLHISDNDTETMTGTIAGVIIKRVVYMI